MDTLNTSFNFTAADADGVVTAEHRIRIVILDGAPWFVAADVCRAPGVYVYSGKPNVRDATRRLGADEVRTEGVDRFHSLGMDPRAKAVTLISESGLYKLIMRSDAASAGPFQEWVTREVLPGHPPDVRLPARRRGPGGGRRGHRGGDAGRGRRAGLASCGAIMCRRQSGGACRVIPQQGLSLNRDYLTGYIWRKTNTTDKTTIQYFVRP